MKVTLLFLVFCGVLGISFAWGGCEKQSDCEEDECCLNTLFYKEPYCEKRWEAGKVCSAPAYYSAEKDLYYITCPCVKNYECVGEKTTENGVTFMRNSKCVLPTK